MKGLVSTIDIRPHVEALQIVHLLADLVRDYAKNTILPEQLELSQFLRVIEFLGHKKTDESK